MWRVGPYRIPRTSVYSFIAVTVTFWALYLFICVVDQASVRDTKVRRTDVDRVERFAQQRWSKQGPGKDGAWTWETSPYNAQNKRKSSVTISPAQPTKLILWQAVHSGTYVEAGSDMFKDCPVKSCEVRTSGKFASQSEAIIFDDRATSRRTPPGNRDKTVLIYYSMRPPLPYEVYTTQTEEADNLFAQYWKSAITWVWSYRVDADIFEPFSYLKKVDRETKPFVVADAVRKKTKLAAFIDPQVSRKKDFIDVLDKNFHSGHSQTSVWAYLEEFEDVAEVDAFEILDLTQDMSNTKKPLAISRYFFLLAFEWVDCVDYVSDLFFYAFDPRLPVVPVVRGGEKGFNYSQHFPRGTFVNADDFPSAKELAKHLEQLSSDTKAYTEMLRQKSQYVREPGLNHAWCQLCSLLHRSSKEPDLKDRHEDIYAWQNEGGGCRVSTDYGDEDDEDDEDDEG